ncbi:unnamed protein product [Schistocephalus solidus]|uniref:Uncharacterized protein n=1 Tax=Schistocephalus solidus TaxID=70667 RepID=A0A183T312_SCHSO|nr:unnamed protein product [Schistocephalus solidus]
MDCDNRFNWEASEVVAMANTKQAREFVEAWHSNANSINHHVNLDDHYEGPRARLTDSSRHLTHNSASMFDQVEIHGRGILPHTHIHGRANHNRDINTCPHSPNLS